jgi:hypothetical protein
MRESRINENNDDGLRVVLQVLNGLFGLVFINYLSDLMKPFRRRRFAKSNELVPFTYLVRPEMRDLRAYDDVGTIVLVDRGSP